MYIITKINKCFAHGARVTKETPCGKTENIDDIIALARKQGADPAEIVEELEEYGCTQFKGYAVDVW